MNRCPITYQECGDAKYSRQGLHKLSPRLKALNDFPLTSDMQRKQAIVRAAKMSIQGIQPKLSAKLSTRDATFLIVDKGGQYILKPQHETYEQLPENEDLTMRLAAEVGIDAPFHGMVYCVDGSLTYFIKRFDRYGRGKKYAIEDFAQLAGKDRDTKYAYSIERMIPLLDLCTFPAIEKAHFFKRILFNYLVGNEDMHLKNFSLITRSEKVELAPAYDFLNTTIAFLQLGVSQGDIEESALTLAGKKRKLTRQDFVEYLAVERLKLTDKALGAILDDFRKAIAKWHDLIDLSFLSVGLREKYHHLIRERCATMKL